MIRISKGLTLPIAGEPRQSIEPAPLVRSVALVSADYLGMKPTMAVEEGQRVKLGQLLFADKKTAGVNYTSPGCGRIAAVVRGAKRAFLGVVIDLDGEDEETFVSYQNRDLGGLTRDEVRENLVNSGLWTAIRKRPFSKVPAPASVPHSIFVTAIDTSPLAADPAVVIAERESDFVYGLQALRHLTDGSLYLCRAAGAKIPGGDLDFVTVAEFGGPHPAGLPGTHIHFLDPVSDKKSVWHVNYQDVLAIGRLFATGRLSPERVIAVGGPVMKNPRLLRTRLGAKIDDLLAGELQDGENRVISGSVLCGRQVVEPMPYLGRYHLQVSALPEGRKREFLGWQSPGLEKFSAISIFLSSFAGIGKKFKFTTSEEGSKRAMVPIGLYERVMPLDIIPTMLLRSLIVRDTEQAAALGALELDEEDLGLCTFVCPGKYEYGPLLRENLTRIEKEG